MAAGDETVMGPYPTNQTGADDAGAAMDTAFDGVDDKYVVVPGAQNLQFWVIHIEGQ